MVKFRIVWHSARPYASGAELIPGTSELDACIQFRERWPKRGILSLVRVN